MKESARLIRLLFQLVDRAVRLQLTGKAKERAEKIRKTIERQKQKAVAEENEEAVLAKKREKDLKWKEKLKGLPPAEQRKLEEKKREKEREKAKKRLSKMVKF